MQNEHQTYDNPTETTIMVEGLPEPVTLLHVTDSHISQADERDPEAIPVAERIRQQFQAQAQDGLPTLDHFRGTLARYANEVDAIVLTGDIMHFPSYANIDTVSQELSRYDTPALYTLGNHDWNFPYMPWNDEIRAAYYPRFNQLMSGNPACQAETVGGIRLIAIDNSNYQVTEEQLGFLREQLALGLPSILLVHIPIALPTLYDDVFARWKAPIMMAAEGWTPETMEKWRVRTTDPSTQECHEFLTQGNVDNLLGIFCGHVHFTHTDQFQPGRYQYITHPGFDAGYRIIRLLPAK